METGLNNRVALVLGASEGIGRAVAEALAGEKVRVAIVARRPEPLEALRKHLYERGAPDALAIPANVAQAHDLQRVFDQLLAHFGTIHILVTNAGSPPEGYFLECTDAMWQEGFEQNYLNLVRTARLVIPIMQKNRWGRIINISSVASRQPLERLTISNALRSGLSGLIRTMANEFSKDQITINNILPGFTHTDRVTHLAERMAGLKGVSPEAIVQQWQASIPAGRLANPAEIGQLALFLASEAAAYITGTNIPIDGGFLKGVH